MKIVRDCFGRNVRLTQERIDHILDHSEMSDMLEQIQLTLEQPEIVRRSKSDPAVELYYRFFVRTVVGAKWLCVVVKYVESDAFVVTAYLTDRPKDGIDLWPIE